MTAFFYWSGAVLWSCIAGLLVFSLGWTLYCLAGYIYGQFRVRRLGGFRIHVSAPRLVKWGFREWLNNFPNAGGWYNELDGKKVYLFGFHKIDSEHLL